MLAYNLGIKDRRLSLLDGWADCDDKDARVTHEHFRGWYVSRIEATG